MNKYRTPVMLPEELLRGGSHDAGGIGLLVSDLICTTTEYMADTTWTQPANMIAVYYEAQGGGGGGGGVDVGVGESATGGGGGGGAYEAGWLLKRQVGKSEAISIGVGGTAGADTGGNGGGGGATSFGSHVSAPGGSGGAGTTVDGGDGAGGVGGTASGSSVNFSGQAGQASRTPAGAAFVLTASGGHSYMGWGSRPRLLATGDSLAGQAGQGFGSGAAGAAACQEGTGRAGAAGSDGKLILHVWTYAKA